ncbi:hydroxymethylglutaryl-CoA lyase [Ferroacidibacillus organovorans]|uniref:Hydroxymethylglutaryl-CoA lyase n=1 Tax=Ferroacidibacillus organovorans TaxID=1765683 RepID=A0A853KET5_9BACL|nr:hydroxymethylglutaryl-CoA lyase [Ferroacidibacillus organovorans]KYP79281.1 hydroxymethylglutaryl-CoA lyase [Ferroacidibacillus organovorans]OAG95273.1 hydroxymethylglutaryl-CoA lyase [Ferroacidibacillus organovorans]
MRPTIPVRDNGTPLPRQVEMIDVSPRDGLQNEPVLVSVDKKKELILRLSKAGFRRIETTSFVHPKWVPQMADAEAIVSYCNQLGITYITLTPNLKALERALAADVPQIAVFIGASNAFNQKNVNRTTDESLAECEPLFARAKQRGVFVRAYVSTVWHCPYQGSVSYDEVDHVVKRFVDLGADEIDLGDTNGQAHPQEVFERCQSLKEAYPEMPFVGHFHDTSKLALANVYAALLAGIDRFDASTGGLGGCPFSPGATGNVATEDVLAMLDKMGIHTGIDLHAETVSFARSLSTRI